MKKILFTHQGPHKVHGAFADTITDNWYRYGDNYPEIIKNLYYLYLIAVCTMLSLLKVVWDYPMQLLKKLKILKPRSFS